MGVPPVSNGIVHLLILSVLYVSQSMQQTIPTNKPNQFAELYAPGEASQRFQVTSLDVWPDNDLKLNTILIGPINKDTKVTKSPEMLSRHQRLQTEDGATYEPLVHPDAPHFTVQRDVRQKRQTDWMSAYKKRYLAYHKMQETSVEQRSATEAPAITQPKTTTTAVSKTTTTTTTTVNRGKFARQFPADETASNDDNAASDNEKSDEEDDETTTLPTTTTPVTSTWKRKVKMSKPPVTTKRTTTTTTTTTSPATAEPDQEDSEDEDPDSMVQNIINDIGRKKGSPLKNQVDNDDMPLWARKDLVHELDPRKNKKLRDMIVEKHNYLRSLVIPAAANMLKMEWNDEAAKISQRWAEECKFEHDPGAGRHTSEFHCGQNLARGWPQPLSWNLTMQLWFDERKDFVFDGHPRGMVGHYTQLVWYGSYQIGCGYKDCGKFHHYVCDYCPAGNVDSRKYKPYKSASKSCSSCPDDCENQLCTNTCPYVNKYGNCDDLEKEFQVCTDTSYGVTDSCLATCKCKNKIY